MKQFFLYNKKAQEGFTMMEMLVAIAIGMAVGLTVTLVATNGLKSMRYIRNLERLHASAGYINENFSYWVKEAQTINVSGSTMISVLPDGTQKEFKLQGNNLLIDNVSIIPAQTAKLRMVASNLTFYNKPASVRISYTLTNELNSSETLNISTTIARRNFPH
jgi:prepilin-type N-terminal cleavage/methylation domain-containing protein